MVLCVYACVRKKVPMVEPSHPMIQDQDQKIGEIAEIKKRDIQEVTEREYQLLKEIENPSFGPFFQTGIASWYGGKFHGRRTSNGEVYDMYKLTAAHKTLPFNTIVEVRNLENGEKVIVRINDRGPFIKNRIIDLSYKAANRLRMADQGVALVGLEIINKKAIKKYQNQYVSGQDYMLQAGAFREKKNAKKLLKRIKRIVSEVVFSIKIQDGYFKVISEKIGTRKQVEQLKRRLEDFDIDSFIKDCF
jgi:rare lipoprotein A